jgi:N-acetylmuramoyl-L-alanine amidase
MKTVILDAGHGINTPGKCSPIWDDGSYLLEWEFNRDIVSRIAEGLPGIQVVILVPEDADVDLGVRCYRANKVHASSPDGAFLISIHANAGGGKGWEAFTSQGKTLSDSYATILYEEAQSEFPDMRMRKDLSDGDYDKESSFYILRNTHCPAVLTENFFMDHEPDCRLIMSEYGRTKIANMHIRAIKRILSL